MNPLASIACESSRGFINLKFYIMVTIFIIAYIILSAAGLLGMSLDSDISTFNKIVMCILLGWITFPIILMIFIGFVISNYINNYR